MQEKVLSISSCTREFALDFFDQQVFLPRVEGIGGSPPIPSTSLRILGVTDLAATDQIASVCVCVVDCVCVSV